MILATVASVEAIFLSTFVLISQNRAGDAANRRADLDLQINLLAEHEVTRLISLTSRIAAHLGIREANDPTLEELERHVGAGEGARPADRGRRQRLVLMSERTKDQIAIREWWAVRGSNPRPAVCKTDALPTELTAREA